jgi:hypothetical protein
MVLPPSAIITAASVRTRPRSWPGLKIVAAQGLGQGLGQAAAVGDQPQSGGAGVGDDAFTVAGDGQPL